MALISENSAKLQKSSSKRMTSLKRKKEHLDGWFPATGGIPDVQWREPKAADSKILVFDLWIFSKFDWDDILGIGLYFSKSDMELSQFSNTIQFYNFCQRFLA